MKTSTTTAESSRKTKPKRTVLTAREQHVVNEHLIPVLQLWRSRGYFGLTANFLGEIFDIPVPRMVQILRKDRRVRPYFCEVVRAVVWTPRNPDVRTYNYGHDPVNRRRLTFAKALQIAERDARLGPGSILDQKKLPERAFVEVLRRLGLPVYRPVGGENCIFCKVPVAYWEL